MNKRNCVRIIAAILCAAMLAPAAGSALAQTAPSGAVRQLTADQERFYGEHLGYTGTSVNWSVGGEYKVNANVDYASGNLYLGIRNPLRDFTLAYNSQDEGATNFGNGVTSSYHQTILPVADVSGDFMIYTKGDGNKMYLDKRIDEEGAIWWDWFMQQPNGELYQDGFPYNIFDAQGSIRQIRIPWLSYLELMQISRDPLGNVIGTSAHFDTSPEQESKRVELDYDRFGESARSVELRYDEFGALKSKILFRYDQRGNLRDLMLLDDRENLLAGYHFEYEDLSSRVAQVADVQTGEQISYRYTLLDGRYKVSFMQKTDAAGNLLDQTQFAYGNGQTVIIDKNGNTTVKTY